MSYVVEPLFAEWARFSDTRLSQTMLGHLGLNKASWGGLMQEPSTSSEEAEPSPAATATPSQPTAASTELNVTTVADKSNSKAIPQGSRES